jgi:putative exporter of polyketide antibiotics
MRDRWWALLLILVVILVVPAVVSYAARRRAVDRANRTAPAARTGGQPPGAPPA